MYKYIFERQMFVYRDNQFWIKWKLIIRCLNVNGVSNFIRTEVHSHWAWIIDIYLEFCHERYILNHSFFACSLLVECVSFFDGIQNHLLFYIKKKFAWLPWHEVEWLFLISLQQYFIVSLLDFMVSFWVGIWRS